MLRAGAVSFACVLLVVGALGRAAAQDTGALMPTDCPEMPAGGVARREAGRLFQEGEAASHALRVAAAGRAFACSYLRMPTAQAAYNAGIAYEALDDAARASLWFRRYLEQSPTATDRAEVEARVATAEARLAGERARAEEAARAQAERERAAEEARLRAEAAQRQAIEERRARELAEAEIARRGGARAPGDGLGGLGIAGLAVSGTGVVAVVIGGVLYAISDALHAEFVAGGRQDAARASDGQTYDAAASGLWIAGGVLVLAGAATVVIDLLDLDAGAPREASVRVAPLLVPMTDGFVAGVRGAL